MEHQQNYLDSEDSMKFSLLSEKLLTLTQSRVCDRKLLNECFQNINELNFRLFTISDKNAMMLLINQLCSIIQPSEVSLVIECSQFLVNLIKRGITMQGRTFSACKRWVLECLEFSKIDAIPSVLSALQGLFITGPFVSIAQDFRKLIRENSILLKWIYPYNQKWDENQYLAISSLKAILANEETKDNSIAPEHLLVMKTTALNILSKISCQDVDKLYFSKMVSSCLRILHNILMEKSCIDDKETIGELLGVVQAYLFHGIRGYKSIIPPLLRPSTMNLPDMTQSVQNRKYFRNYKNKHRRQPNKKTEAKAPNSDSKITYRNSSDSETSDTEQNRNTAISETRVRLEAVYLLNAIVSVTSDREFFGYWTQVVASGSRTDGRTLTQSILREPYAKTRQVALSTLNDLLIGARIFLSHAEEVERLSFVTFFGMLSSVIKELHCALSLLLSTEINVVVLTQALKCVSALIQGTPYSRLKPGLATKLIRNCRCHLLHRDPTVRVGAISVFETLTLVEPITPEIFNILAKCSNVDSDSEFSKSEINSANDTEVEEIIFDDFNENLNQLDFDEDVDDQESHVSTLVQICFKNVSNGTANEPVRLQSLKLLGTLAFNATSLILAHIEVITKSLIEITKETESQVSFHACRALEIIAGRLAELKSDDVSKFWNIALNPIISLVQSPLTNLREVACDCLGNIGAEMFAQLSRDKSIMIITVLFGAVKDEESAVRAASLRALGLLVCLDALEEDTGFLMDLADIASSATKDRNLGVRVKAAWALASVCDCLVKRENNPEVEPILLDVVLPKLYTTSVQGATDNEKVKCNAVRAIGSIIFLCPDKSILQDVESGLDALINCATVGNDMKVRWNACRAIGIILSRNPDAILPSSWRDKVFPVLCDLICNSPNFKVRTNAAWALSICESFDKYIVTLWKSIILGFENSQHVPSYVEYPHRDALVQQLCLTLCHLAKHTDITELESLWLEIKDHFEEISHHIKQFQEYVLPEKAGDLTEAKVRFSDFIERASRSNEKYFASKILELFKKEDRYDKVDASSTLN